MLAERFASQYLEYLQSEFHTASEAATSVLQKQADHLSAEMRQIEDQHLSDCVFFCGRKVADEKWAHFRRADIFCFPSYYQAESFGNVLVEAMMFELPVVSTRWRGIPDIVEDGVTGFLTPVKDAAEVADRLAQLLHDEQLRMSMGRKGRWRYLELFTVENYINQTERVVLDVVRRKVAG